MGYCSWHLFLVWMLCILGRSRLQQNGGYGMRIKPLNRSHVSRIDTSGKVISTNFTFTNLPQEHNASSTIQNSKKIATSLANTLAQSLYNKWPTAEEKTPNPSNDAYSSLADRYKKGATFFFTQVEPHRFEYRAMFQHKTPNFANFEPFVNNFEPFGGGDFPPLPKFPKLFSDDPFPKLPNFADFPFPTLRPAIRREWPPVVQTEAKRPVLDENLDGPLKNYDIVLGHVHYPKIFRFNEERINIEEFDRQKKLKFKSTEFNYNDIPEHENVKRNQLLILHGGIFTVKEPPLYNKRRKERKHGYGYKIPFHS